MRMIWLEKVGVDHPLGFPRLAALLDQIAAFLDSAAARRVPGHQSAAAAPGTSDAPVPAASTASFGPGSLSNILQVKDTLAACLGYFRKTEPSSPAVLLIGQAQQLIGKSLIEVIQIMFPEHVDKAVIEIGELRRFRLPLERLPAPDGYEATDDAEQGYAEGADDSGYADEDSPTDARVAEDGGGATEVQPIEAARPPAEAVPAIAIGSRADAVSAMRAVAAFYRQVEPSHPTPLLMDKACGLAQQDFMSLLGNILPDVAQIPESDS
jgi:type VI secretion system protein ImpA